MKTFFRMSLRTVIILLVTSCLLNTYTAKATNINVSGTIAGPTTWSADTVNVSGNVLVANGVVLTVNPGVKVIFQGHYSLDIQGSIKALGTANQPILFTINDTTGFTNMAGNTGGWAGIRIDSTLASNDSSKFDFCRFMYGKAVGTGDMMYGGAIYIFNFNKVLISNSIFDYCRAQNDGGAIYIKSAGALISGNTFTNGQCTRGAGIFCDNSWPRIELNSFSRNYADTWGGGICIANAAAPAIINNLFCNNLAYLGGGIAFFNAGAMTTLVSNTVAENRANYGGGMSSIASDASFTNNIFWGNEAADGHEITLLDPDSDPTFNYCNIQGGLAEMGGSGAGASYSGTYTNNLNAYPEFNDTLANDFQIKTSSPCLDAGTPDTTGLHLTLTDVASNPRINMGRIDIGAFERQQVITFCGNIMQNTFWNADTVKVNCDITVDSNAVLTIAPGVYVEMQGTYEIYIQGLIQAVGTDAEPITFTAKDQINGWKGLRIKAVGASSDSSAFHYCTISYVKNTLPVVYGGMLLDSSSAVSIMHCNINNNRGQNGGGITLQFSSPLIAYCDISDNTVNENGGGLFLHSGSAPRLKDLILSYNTANYGGGIYVEYGFIQAENLLISNNHANFGGGISTDTSLVLLTNTLFVNNLADVDGGGLLNKRSDITLNNTNIANNWATRYGGGLCLENTALTMNNSILYGNTDAILANSEVYVSDTNCTTTINNSDIEGDSTAFDYAAGSGFQGSYNQNIDILPEFKTPSAGSGTSYNGVDADWSLGACSPLFNQGTPDLTGLYILSYDFDGNMRVFADTVDIGAYELVKPIISDQPTDTVVCAGNDVYFSTEVASSIAVTYQWQIKPSGSGSFVNATGPGAATATYTVTGTTPVMNGDQYQCIISAACSTGEITSVAELTVNTIPAIQLQPLNVSVCQGSTANFIIGATGSDLSYQWQQRPFGSATWSNCIGASATTAAYSIPGTPPALNNYSYRCLVNGSCLPGDTSVIVDLTVKSLPGVVTQPTNQSVCIGDNASFTVSGNGTGITYQWQESTDGGATWNNLTGSTSTSINLTSVTIGMAGYRYRCVITGDCSPAATSNAATLTVNTSPLISQQPANTDACVYSNVTISTIATGGNLTFQWQQKAPADVAWTNAPGLSALTANYQLVNVSMLMNGYKYRCLISGSCPPTVNSDSITLSVHNLPGFYAGPDTTMLLSHTIILDAGAGFSSYLWSTTETTQTISVVGSVVGIGAHSYSCTITDANGCQNNDALIVTVLDDTGIDPITGKATFEITPNPVTDFLMIHTADQQVQSIHLRAIDMLGKCMLNTTYEANSGALINVAAWPAGLYFIQINQNNSSQQYIINKL